jgi:hypothetical protein
VPAFPRRVRALLSVAIVLVASFGAGLTPATAAPANRNGITRSGSTLMLNGAPYRFTGMNAYQLATLWSVNSGCGGQLSDTQLDTFFAGLRPNSVVRFWAFQALGVNKTTHTIDYTGIDRVFRTAERYGQRLIPVLGNQSGVCDDGHWKDSAWYAGAYTRTFDDTGLGRSVVSYSSWVSSVVNRYKASTALGMWEPVNEPETSDCAAGYLGSACYSHKTCPTTAAATLRGFFDRVGAQIKSLDKTHLIASGVMGGGQCGAKSTEYTTIHQSPYVDVATYHDYGADAVVLPGDAWNGMAVRISQARSINKPFFTEEVGIKAAGDATLGCVDPATRADLLGAKLNGQLAAGAIGFLPWFYAPAMGGGCVHDLAATDPVLPLLRTVKL